MQDGLSGRCLAHRSGEFLRGYVFEQVGARSVPQSGKQVLVVLIGSQDYHACAWRDIRPFPYQRHAVLPRA